MARQMSNSFTEAPLVVGSIYGVRSFMSANGMLYGPVRGPDAFKPGVNTARCHYDPFRSITDGASCPGIASIDCTCGFYAYFDASQLDFGSYRTIEGIIEGTGHVVVGQRGFRCEKARIVALVDPFSAYHSLGSARRLLCRIATPSMRLVMTMQLAVMAIIMFGVLIDNMALVRATTPFSLVCCAWFGGSGIYRIVRSKGTATFDRALRECDRPATSLRKIEEMKRTYPDVTWYATLDEACESYPLLGMHKDAS